MTVENTSKEIYIVAYGEYKIPDEEYADGFRWAWCEGIAVGAYTDLAVAEAVALASERGHLTSVRINEVSEDHRHILEGLGRDQHLPARSPDHQGGARLDQIEYLACLLDDRVTMQGKARMMVAEEIVSAVERRVRKELLSRG